ncbi:hypothetical protein LCGC14_2811150, partial [marine sediment metagenome]
MTRQQWEQRCKWGVLYLLSSEGATGRWWQVLQRGRSFDWLIPCFLDEGQQVVSVVPQIYNCVL